MTAVEGLPGRAPAAGPGGAEGGHPQPPSAAPLEDGFGNEWDRCGRDDCGLEIVRPGSVQCWCDDEPCRDCNGSGSNGATFDGRDLGICPRCGGDGYEPAVAAAVLAAVTPPTPKWCGYDAALLWELLLNDSDEERHTRLTGLIACAAEMAGAQEEASRLADQVEALRIELDETRAQQRCECGKPLSHLYAQSDSPDWACRVPTT